jgi:hypothetical protein
MGTHFDIIQIVYRKWTINNTLPCKNSQYSKFHQLIISIHLPQIPEISSRLLNMFKQCLCKLYIDTMHKFKYTIECIFKHNCICIREQKFEIYIKEIFKKLGVLAYQCSMLDCEGTLCKLSIYLVFYFQFLFVSLH